MQMQSERVNDRKPQVFTGYRNDCGHRILDRLDLRGSFRLEIRRVGNLDVIDRLSETAIEFAGEKKSRKYPSHRLVLHGIVPTRPYHTA